MTLSALSLLLVTLGATSCAAVAILHANEYRSVQSLCSSSTFHLDATSDYKILSIDVKPQHNYTTQYTPGLDFCDVDVHLTHPGANDDVSIRIWLPLTPAAWNGRYEATGGAGWATGGTEDLPGIAIYGGFATATTDGGHSSDYNDASWALNADKTINWPLMYNFASRSLAEMITVGKAITAQYYGKPPHHSYFAGCSTGGRQGYMLAQQYPGIVDGILANAPGINMVHGAMGLYWPQLVMQESGTLMTPCQFDYFSDKVLEKCDILDGASDGVVVDPDSCGFDPNTLVGDKVQCDGKETQITQAMADVVRKIEEGPRTPYGENIWHGFPYGIDTSTLANVTVGPDGQLTQKPFLISSSYMQFMLAKNAALNVTTLSYSDYVAIWSEGAYNYGWLLNAHSPDLFAFEKAGGKMITWHGVNDNVLPFRHTLTYRKNVELLMGSSATVDNFYRLFLAPGVEHCGGGAGAQPTNPIQQLVDWVEKGEAPDTLDAATYNEKGELVTRELCMWPTEMKYMGVGDINRASSWSCVGGSETIHDRSEGDQLVNRASAFLGGLSDRLMGLGMDLNII